MKIIKNAGRVMLTATACLYAFCLFNGITFFDYIPTPQGGTLSIAGYSLDVSSHAANTFWQVYADIESKAAELLPRGIQRAVEWISDKLPS